MCTLQDWLPLDSRVAQRMSFDRLRALGPMRRPYHEPRASERRAIASAEMQDACLVESRDICLRRRKTGVVGVLGNSFYSTPAERNLHREPLCRRPRAYLCGGARKPARCWGSQQGIYALRLNNDCRPSVALGGKECGRKGGRGRGCGWVGGASLYL